MDMGIPDTAETADTADGTDAARLDVGPTDASSAAGDAGFPAMADEGSQEPASRRSIDDIERLLDEVESALARLDDGTYGRCSACGATLDDDRLAESPTATRCTECDADAADGG